MEFTESLKYLKAKLKNIRLVVLLLLACMVSGFAFAQNSTLPKAISPTADVLKATLPQGAALPIPTDSQAGFSAVDHDLFGPVDTLFFNTYLYVGSQASLAIYSVNNPASPLLLGWVDMPYTYNEEIKAITKSGDYLYVATWMSGLVVVWTSPGFVDRC